MQARVLLNQSQYLLQAGLFDFAIKASNRLLNEDGNVSEALFVRAYAYKELGKYQEALTDLNKYIKQKPNLSKGYSLRGLVFALIDKGLSERAFADFQASASLAPRDNTSFRNIEELFTHFDKAAIFADIKALPRDVRIPLLKDCLNENTYFGSQFKKPRGFKECSIQAGVLKKIHRYHHRITSWTAAEWTRLGDKKNLQGKYRAAALAYSEALEVLEDDAFEEKLSLYLERGNMLYHLNNIEAALNDYHTTIVMDPGHFGAHINRAAILSLNTLPGQLAQSIEAYQVIHELILEGAIVLTDKAEAILNKDIAEMFRRHGKQGVLEAIKSLPEAKQITLLEQCLLEDNYLGQHFWVNKIPGTSCDLNKGTLGEIQGYLRRLQGEDEPVLKPKPSLLDRAIRFFSPASVSDEANHFEMQNTR